MLPGVVGLPEKPGTGEGRTASAYF